MKRALVRQFLIFSAIGVVNTLIDFLVFNGLSHLLGLHSTVQYVLWKSAGFITASVNSYFMNQKFTFTGKRTKREMTRFGIVTLTTFALSTSSTALLFHMLSMSTSLSNILIGNICVLVGVGINVVVNFIGYKVFVFK